MNIDILYQKSKISHKIRDWSFLKNYENDVIKLYNEGFGIANIAQKIFISDKISLGVKRSFVNRILKENNVHIRSSHEQVLFDYQTGVRDRFVITQQANKARRGSKVSQKSKEKRAKYLEQNHIVNLKHSKYEQMFYNFLIKNKISFEYQKAFEQYNVDFVFDNLAVELTGGHFRDYNDEAFQKKRDCVLKHGIDLILVIRCNKSFDAENTYKTYIKNYLENKIIEIPGKARQKSIKI